MSREMVNVNSHMKLVWFLFINDSLLQSRAFASLVLEFGFQNENNVGFYFFFYVV